MIAAHLIDDTCRAWAIGGRHCFAHLEAQFQMSLAVFDFETAAATEFLLDLLMQKEIRNVELLDCFARTTNAEAA